MPTTSISFVRRDEPGDARQVRSRNALIAALLTLLEERPFDQLTIREISAQAGTGYATFFRHYSTKEALLGDCAAEQVSILTEMMTPIFHADDRRQPITQACEHVWEHRKTWQPLLTGGAAAIVRNEFIRQARELSEIGPAQLKWLPGDLGLVYGAGSTFDLLAWWLLQEKPQEPHEMSELIYLLIIAPLFRE